MWGESVVQYLQTKCFANDGTGAGDSDSDAYGVCQLYATLVSALYSLKGGIT